MWTATPFRYVSVCVGARVNLIYLTRYWATFFMSDSGTDYRFLRACIAKPTDIMRENGNSERAPPC